MKRCMDVDEYAKVERSGATYFLPTLLGSRREGMYVLAYSIFN